MLTSPKPSNLCSGISFAQIICLAFTCFLLQVSVFCSKLYCLSGFFSLNSEPCLTFSALVLNNKGHVKLELCLTSLRHSGNYPGSLVISECTYLQSIGCLIMYLPEVMKSHLLGKMLETRIRWEFLWLNEGDFVCITNWLSRPAPIFRDIPKLRIHIFHHMVHYGSKPNANCVRRPLLWDMGKKPTCSYHGVGHVDSSPGVLTKKRRPLRPPPVCESVTRGWL